MAPPLPAGWPDVLEPGWTYAHDVVAGELEAPAGALQACQRFLDGLAEAPREPNAEGEADTVFHFDPEAGAAVVAAAYLFRHVKGPLTGKRLELAPWQVWAIMDLFGWVDEHGHRRYRQAFWGVPRGNGKTALAAYLALVVTFLEGEGGAEGYSAAVTRDQARICFNAGRLMMARADRSLREEFGVTVRTHDVVADDGATYFKPLSSDADSLDGLSVHLAVVDEVASHKTSEVYDALLTGCGKRSQPLLLSITTATNNLAGIGRNLWTYSEKLLTGVEKNERFHAVVYAASAEDDPWSEDTWRKVNPNWGVSVMPQAIRSIARQARRNAAQEAAFKTRHLNLWVGADEALFSSTAWAACAQPDLQIHDLAGQRGWLALDLSSTTDLAALVACVPHGGTTAFFARLYIPRLAVLEQRVASYPQWLEEGALTLCGEDTIDQEQILRDVLEWAEVLDVVSVAYDPWQASKLVGDLQAEAPALTAVEFRQTVKNYSEPTKEMDARIKGRRVVHDGNPALAWCISNVVGHYDTNNNVRPNRPHPRSKIDGAVAAIMALAGSMFGGDEGVTSVHAV